MADNYTKAKKLIQDEIDVLTTYIDQANKIIDSIPVAEKALERKRWQERTLVSMPIEGHSYIPDNYVETLSKSNKFIKDYFSNAFKPTTSSLGTLSAISSIDSTSTLGLTEIRHQDHTAEWDPWATSVSGELVLLQKKHQITNEVSDYFNQYDQSRANQFQSSIDAFYISKSATGDFSSAALKFRRLIEEFKGDLIKATGEQAKKSSHWELIAKYLSKGDQYGPEYQALLKEGVHYKELHLKFTNIGKGIESIYRKDFEKLYAKLLEHLYSVINLINRDKFIGKKYV